MYLTLTELSELSDEQLRTINPGKLSTAQLRAVLEAERKAVPSSSVMDSTEGDEYEATGVDQGGIIPGVRILYPLFLLTLCNKENSLRSSRDLSAKAVATNFSVILY